MFDDINNGLEPWITCPPSHLTPHRVKRPVKNPKFFQALVHSTLEANRTLMAQEFNLILTLQNLAQHSAHRYIGYKTLKGYCIKALHMSDSKAEAYATVAIKAKECQKLQSLLQEGKISVEKAKKIAGVLTVENQGHWIELALTLNTKQLEQKLRETK